MWRPLLLLVAVVGAAAWGEVGVEGRRVWAPVGERTEGEVSRCPPRGLHTQTQTQPPPPHSWRAGARPRAGGSNRPPIPIRLSARLPSHSLTAAGSLLSLAFSAACNCNAFLAFSRAASDTAGRGGGGGGGGGAPAGAGAAATASDRRRLDAGASGLASSDGRLGPMVGTLPHTTHAEEVRNRGREWGECRFLLASHPTRFRLLGARERAAMPPPPPPGDEEAAALADARAELAACVLNSSWLGSVGGVALAIPLCLRRKSYTPLLLGMLGGTVADMAIGLKRCGEASAAAAAAADTARHK